MVRPRLSRSSDDVDRAYGEMLRRIPGGLAAGRLSAYLAQDPERLVDRAFWQAQLDGLRSVVEAALRSLTGTALVCENDSLALYCLTMLRGAGVRVPQERSVVGFDDEEDAFLCGLSSCNFNVAAVVAAMVDFIVRPYSAPRPAANLPVVIDGYVRAVTYHHCAPGSGTGVDSAVGQRAERLADRHAGRTPERAENAGTDGALKGFSLQTRRALR